MTTDRNLSVVYICGGLPLDMKHLQTAAQEVDLTVYRSTWLPPALKRGFAEHAPEGLKVRSFKPMLRWTGMHHLHFWYAGLRRALTQDQPDVIHVLSEPWGMLPLQAALWVRANPRARLVLHGCCYVWHHGSAPEQLLRRAILRKTLAVTAGFAGENAKAVELAQTSGDRTSAYARIHTSPRDAAVFRPPSNEERLRARHELGIGRDEVAVGLLSRLVPYKGVNLFLDSAEQLLANGFRGRFFIAGDGPLRDEVARRESDRIIALGQLPFPTGVLGFLRAVDLLACPSERDQGPRSVLEAMMTGCTPVVTPVGGVPEMVEGRGVVARTASTDDFAAALACAAERVHDPEWRAHVARSAHGQYSSDSVAGQMVDLWRSATSPLKLAERVG